MKSSRCLAATIVLAAMIASSPLSANAACFARLQPSDSHNTADWKDLVEFVPPIGTPTGARQFQKIPDGRLDKINLDFYSVTFTKPPENMEDFFLAVRKRFGFFARGDDKDNDFVPYRGPAGSDLEVRYRALWESKDPTGALMTFVLAQLYDLSFATLQGVHPTLKNGDVVATCASPTDFIFSTVTSEKNSKHPVNGNRGFGIEDNHDGTWTFYTKGADRETSGGTPDPRHPSQPMFLDNFLARLKEQPKIGPDADDTVFQLGHKFWIGFFGKFEDYLNQRGLSIKTTAVNSQRYNYPL